MNKIEFDEDLYMEVWKDCESRFGWYPTLHKQGKPGTRSLRCMAWWLIVGDSDSPTWQCFGDTIDDALNNYKRTFDI